VPPHETLHDRGDSPTVDVALITVRGGKPGGERLLATARIASAAAERNAVAGPLKTFSRVERRAMIEVLDCGVIGWRSMGPWISLHGLTAVNASLVASSEFVLDVGRNTETVRHRTLILSALSLIEVMARDSRHLPKSKTIPFETMLFAGGEPFCG
jgi:hypothetical protein